MESQGEKALADRIERLERALEAGKGVEDRLAKAESRRWVAWVALGIACFGWVWAWGAKSVVLKASPTMPKVIVAEKVIATSYELRQAPIEQGEAGFLCGRWAIAKGDGAGVLWMHSPTRTQDAMELSALRVAFWSVHGPQSPPDNVLSAYFTGCLGTMPYVPE